MGHWVCVIYGLVTARVTVVVACVIHIPKERGVAFPSHKSYVAHDDGRVKRVILVCACKIAQHHILRGHRAMQSTVLWNMPSTVYHTREHHKHATVTLHICCTHTQSNICSHTPHHHHTKNAPVESANEQKLTKNAYTTTLIYTATISRIGRTPKYRSDARRHTTPQA